MKAKLLPSIALGAICLIVASMLALINSLTEKRVEQNQLDAINASLTEVLSGHSDFETVETTSDMPSSIQLIKKSKEGGYVFTAVVTGKNPGLTVIVGITPDGKISGTKYTAGTETEGYADKVFAKTESGLYKGKTIDDVGSFDGEPYKVTGSTLTSLAYAKAVKDALTAFSILEGGAE